MVVDKRLQRWMISAVACALLSMPAAHLWSAMACHRVVTTDQPEWTFRSNKVVPGHRTPELRGQYQGPGSQPVRTPLELTAEQDHKLKMQQLNISSLRSGANPNAPNSVNAPNYDEAKANPYPNLPDPLLLKNGKRVTTGRDWLKLRRPEIVEDFDREIYGRVPANTPKINWEVISTTQEKNGDRDVVTRKIAGHVDN